MQKPSCASVGTCNMDWHPVLVSVFPNLCVSVSRAFLFPPSYLFSRPTCSLLSFFPPFTTLPSVPISIPSSLHPFSPFHEFATAFFFVLTQSFHYLLPFLYPSTKWADCAFEMHGSPTFSFLLLTSHQRHEFSLTHLMGPGKVGESSGV